MVSSRCIIRPHESGTEPEHPLGKAIRIRLDLDGCKDLPRPQTTVGNIDTCCLYDVTFEFISSSKGAAIVQSERAYEGRGFLRGTVQWDETFYIDCFELSYIRIFLRPHGSTNHAWGRGPCSTSVSVAALLSQSSVLLDAYEQPGTSCTLYVSTSQVQQQCASGSRHILGARHDLYTGPTSATESILGAIRQLSYFLETLRQFKVDVTAGYSMHLSMYGAYERAQRLKSRRRLKLVRMLAVVTGIMDTVSNLPIAQARNKRDSIAALMTELNVWIQFVEILASRGLSNDNDSEQELANLTVVIITPDPLAGPSSATAVTLRDTITRTIAKDALLLALEAIVQSSDAFPPLKSAASGLLFFVTCVDVASSNKKQIRDVYRRIDGLAASLERGARHGDPLSPAHQEIAAVLARDIAVLNEDLQDIVSERKSRFKTFFSAKRHREELQDILSQLEAARLNYTTAIATLNATTNARVLAHVQAITLVMGVGPVQTPGTGRAEHIASMFRSAQIEEVGI
ncbi:unnamed protein product [Peniophora sp. CBMAI 1063]|nr:unnamed protein product [Peniophora sp. CBMAI 1063]